MNPQFREPIFYVPDSKTVIDTAVLRDGVFISTINSETLEQVRLRYPGAEVGEFDDVIAGKEDSYKSESVEITAQRYAEMLNVLPPVGWRSARGVDVESFKMAERQYGNITAIYACVVGREADRYFTFYDSILMSADAIAERIVNSEAFKNPAKWVNASYCQNCVWQTRPEMLTTYCLKDARCEESTASEVYANITGRNDPAELSPVPPTADDDVRCTIETLCPDDAIRRCILLLGHVGFCDGGVR